MPKKKPRSSSVNMFGSVRHRQVQMTNSKLETEYLKEQQEKTRLLLMKKPTLDPVDVKIAVLLHAHKTFKAVKEALGVTTPRIMKVQEDMWVGKYEKAIEEYRES